MSDNNGLLNRLSNFSKQIKQQNAEYLEVGNSNAQQVEVDLYLGVFDPTSMKNKDNSNNILQIDIKDPESIKNTESIVEVTKVNDSSAKHDRNKVSSCCKQSEKNVFELFKD